ncbi:MULTISPECIES: hypothetical protein [unclassified Wolbachia]|uniref:hypothetical protein n=1 Tax=unclassified Wolbachia TaxID=2640676 RepID=UPI00209FA7F6|nr:MULTISPECIES: hypothetical protein [unclassified Wolbachia]
MLLFFVIRVAPFLSSQYLFLCHPSAYFFVIPIPPLVIPVRDTGISFHPIIVSSQFMLAINI